MSLRLFIAIPLPEEITARLLTLEADVPGASWRLPEHFHLTLRFLGEIDEALAREVDQRAWAHCSGAVRDRAGGRGQFWRQGAERAVGGR